MCSSDLFLFRIFWNFEKEILEFSKYQAPWSLSSLWTFRSIISLYSFLFPLAKTFYPHPYSSNVHSAFVFENICIYICIRFENMKTNIGRVMPDPFPTLFLGEAKYVHVMVCLWANGTSYTHGYADMNNGWNTPRWSWSRRDREFIVYGGSVK